MQRTTDDGSAVLNEFLRVFLEDLEGGRTRTLADYQALFPGQELLIEREYAHLAGAAQESGATSAEGLGHRAGSADASHFPAAPGKRFGPYVLIRALGRGGQGLVWLARDTRLERLVALKLLTQLATLSPQALERFRREAQIASRLDDAGICSVYEMGTEQEVPFIAMRYVEGETLAALLAAAKETRTSGKPALLALPPEKGREEAQRGAESGPKRVARLVERVARSLHEAHEVGVVHRDVKPGNVIVGRDGLPILLDFGLARVQDQNLSTLTRTGDVFGTPAYMAPEQLTEGGPRPDRRADVYALGVVLYECLTLHRPFEAESREALHRAILTKDPPDPRHFGLSLAEDLKTILAVALEKDRERRYDSAAALAEDLRRFRAGEPILAHAPSQIYRLKKLVRRHRTLAGSLFAILLILATSTVFVVRGMLRERSALRRENTRAVEVLRLSALQELDDLVAEADRLWPAHPESLERYREWLSKAEKLASSLPEHEAKLAELRAKAWPSEEGQSRHAEHPKSAELENARKHVEYLQKQRIALDLEAPVRDRPPQKVGVDLASLPTEAIEVNDLAWRMIDPDRQDWGEEEMGLVLSRRAMELAANSPPSERAQVRDTLAWALFASGRFDEAVAEEEMALEEAAAGKRVEFEGHLERLIEEIDELIDPEKAALREQHVAKLQERIATLEAEVLRRPDWMFADAQDKWWHNQLEKLVDGVKALFDPETGLVSGTSLEHGLGIEKRVEFASTIAEQSVSGSEASATWAKAITSIANSVESPLYRGMRILPQLGLLPIGPDPASGLWEFAHLQTGEPAKRGPDGKLILKEETGLVFVMLSGGTFTMGAQNNNPLGSNYDPGTGSDEGPPHEVAISPFFLSKYEMTQGQWLRCVGRNPSYWGLHKKNHTDSNREGRMADLLNPVESVSWNECTQVLERLGLELPSEAQWEFAARAGTTTIWWTGNEKKALSEAGNVADAYAKAHGGNKFNNHDLDLNDGNTFHARIGSYRANAFGLHDVIGNLFEWCRDGYLESHYQEFYLHKKDPVSNPEGLLGRVIRSGSYGYTARDSHSANRRYAGAETFDRNIGLRPARRITP